MIDDHTDDPGNDEEILSNENCEEREVKPCRLVPDAHESHHLAAKVSHECKEHVDEKGEPSEPPHLWE